MAHFLGLTNFVNVVNVVYPDGKVCISILHEAKEDQFNEQEKMSEKWRPILIQLSSSLFQSHFNSRSIMKKLGTKA